MSKIKLAVIFGGKSSEYSISLHSAGSAIENMDSDKYELIFIGISQEGNWYYYPGDLDGIEHDTWQSHPDLCEVVVSQNANKKGFMQLNADNTYSFLPVDCVFPILHGKNGEDGTIQGLLTLANIPFVGCDHVSSAIAMDKEFTHIVCEAHGIAMAPYVCVRQSKELNYDEVKKEVKEKLSYPLFIKPANAGSSYGISKVKSEETLIEALQFAFEHDKKVIIETGIDSFEIGCAVLGNEDIIVGELDEIDTNNDFFDFDAKYELENTQIHCPARISEELSLQAKQMAKTIYHVLGCSGLSRIDMFVTKQNHIIFNELNTIPGFTKSSRYPTMMKKANMEFKQLIDELVALALKK